MRGSRHSRSKTAEQQCIQSATGANSGEARRARGRRRLTKRHAMIDQPVDQEITVPCRHLRSKEMYYQDYGQQEDEFSSGIFWCGKTHECLGPDGENCGKGECKAGRSCYAT